MKILKKILKIFLIVLIAIVLLLVIAAVGVKVYQKEIISIAVEKVSKQIDTPISIGEVALVPLFKFTKLSVDIGDLSIGDPDNLDKDTLLFVESCKLALNIDDFLDGIYNIEEAEITGLSAKYTMFADGKSNLDYLIEAFDKLAPDENEKPKDTVSDDAPLIFSAEKISFHRIELQYKDLTTGDRAKLFIPAVKIFAKGVGDNFSGDIKGDLILTDCVVAETPIHLMKSCKLDYDISYADDFAVIRSLQLTSEGVDFHLKGDVAIGDTIGLNLSTEGKDINLSILKKYIPQEMMTEYGLKDLMGKLAFTSTVVGDYADSTLLPLVEAHVSLEKGGIKSVEYPELKNILVDVFFTNGLLKNMSTTSVDLKKVKFETAKSKFEMSGQFSDFDQIHYNLKTKMLIHLPDFADYIPKEQATNVAGTVSASFSTYGVVPSEMDEKSIDYFMARSRLSAKLSDFSALLSDSLSIDNLSANIAYKSKGLEVDSINFRSDALMVDLQNSSLSVQLIGNISNLEKLKCDVKKLFIQQNNCSATCMGTVINIENPLFALDTKLELDLEEVMPYIPDSLINSMSGKVNASFLSRGRIDLDSLEVEIVPILVNKSQFGLKLSDLNLDFPDTLMNVSDLSADLSFEKDELDIEHLKGKYRGFNFMMDSSRVKNIYKTIVLNQKEELYVETHITLGDFIYDDFQVLISPFLEEESDLDTTSTEVVDVEPTNWTYLVHGDIAINSVKIDSTEIMGYNINRLHVSDVSALFKIKDSLTVVDQFKFKTFGGEMNNSILYKIKPNGEEAIFTKHNIKEMNIRTLLRDMDNFGQDSLITYQNISGLFSTELNTFIPIIDTVRVDKMCVSGTLKLEDGGVYDYEPAEALSKVSGIKELNNIQFKTLNSSVFVYKNNVYIPRTVIVSNALDVVSFGMMSMATDYQYHLEAKLTTFLLGKNKKKTKKQFEDKKGDKVKTKGMTKLIYALINGKSKVGFDTKAARNKMLNKIRVQEAMLKLIFSPELVKYNVSVDNEK